MGEFSESQAKAARLLIGQAMEGFLPEYGVQATDTQILVVRALLSDAMDRLPE